MKIEFTKLHGLGNDYIYVDTTRFPIADPAAFSRRWSEPHKAIGSDGLILIGSSDKADFSMRIFNADGSEAMMCGNGIRCVGKYVYDHRLTDKTKLTVDTLSGIKVLELHTGADGKVDVVTVDMGCPALAAQADPSQLADPTALPRVDGAPLEGVFVSMGNPHFVMFRPEVISDAELTTLGPKVEHHPLFPSAVNVEFACFTAADRLRMRVWERGSGVTMACGTGACATAVAAMQEHRAPRRLDIEMDGGALQVEWRSDNHVYMTGEACEVFTGWLETE